MLRAAIPAVVAAQRPILRQVHLAVRAANHHGRLIWLGSGRGIALPVELGTPPEGEGQPGQHAENNEFYQAHDNCYAK